MCGPFCYVFNYYEVAMPNWTHYCIQDVLTPKTGASRAGAHLIIKDLEGLRIERLSLIMEGSHSSGQGQVVNRDIVLGGIKGRSTLSILMTHIQVAEEYNKCTRNDMVVVFISHIPTHEGLVDYA
ncbi:uncharacterized protein LOC128279510 [Gossypium arboreum]|uniref:uncharacterized protein LOC128279510 n=1 Tax=Gossypium arboreum TaxID=29729 RepID=UPI0022F16347|nr:uncharacterized protein LOC128279510 [Gossypium arboreum]